MWHGPEGVLNLITLRVGTPTSFDEMDESWATYIHVGLVVCWFLQVNPACLIKGACLIPKQAKWRCQHHAINTLAAFAYDGLNCRVVYDFSENLNCLIPQAFDVVSAWSMFVAYFKRVHSEIKLH